jgi:hypothetical protein
MDAERAPEPAATSRRMWWMLFDLSAVVFGAALVRALYFGADVVPLPLTPERHWGWWLRDYVYWPMDILSLAAPVLAATALFLRKWRDAALALLAFCAVVQGAALALEYTWKMQAPFDALERNEPWRPVQ